MARAFWEDQGAGHRTVLFTVGRQVQNKWKAKLAWKVLVALARYTWAEVTWAAKRPPPLEDPNLCWAPHIARRGRLVWVDMRGEHFSAPFAKGDFERCILHSGAGIRITRLDALEAIDRVANGISPSGFVFHISRCGSTLLRNVLGAAPGSLAIGEPEFIMAAFSNESLPAIERSLKGGIKALGRAYTGEERHFFIKFRSTLTGQLQVFETCFPDVPMLFLYRDPLEVFQKVIAGGGCAWLAAKSAPRLAARLTGLDPSLIEKMSLDEYAARTIGKYYQTAAAHSSRGLALVNYRSLLRPDEIRKILEFFRLDVTDHVFKTIFAVTKKDAKNSREAFSMDRFEEASTVQRELVERWAREPYETLERLSRSLSTGLPERGG